jgi:NADH dehydrogenase/NADH:ubiquinone oxidoreductase subunit G
MKKITCEICGSNDLVKQDGFFACEYCGTKYSLEEAKKMMLEGTVEVTGTVNIGNPIKIVNNEYLSKLAIADNNNKLYFTQYRNDAAFANDFKNVNIVCAIYDEAINLAANEPAAYLHKADFIFNALVENLENSQMYFFVRAPYYINEYKTLMSLAIHHSAEKEKEPLELQKNEYIAKIDDAKRKYEELKKKRYDEAAPQRAEKERKDKAIDKRNKIILILSAAFPVAVFIVFGIIYALD